MRLSEQVNVPQLRNSTRLQLRHCTPPSDQNINLVVAEFKYALKINWQQHRMEISTRPRTDIINQLVNNWIFRWYPSQFGCVEKNLHHMIISLQRPVTATFPSLSMSILYIFICIMCILFYIYIYIVLYMYSVDKSKVVLIFQGKNDGKSMIASHLLPCIRAHCSTFI